MIESTIVAFVARVIARQSGGYRNEQSLPLRNGKMTKCLKTIFCDLRAAAAYSA